MFGLKFLKFGRKKADPRFRIVYDKLVAQARQPVFYTSFSVPDTLSGRFDLIVLHAFLYFHRIKNEDEAMRAFGQEVFDTFFADMDYQLRELGVGYQAVPKRIKKMGEAFYGRVKAYDEALENGDHEALKAVLWRNLLPEAVDEPLHLEGLTFYTREAVRLLRAVDKADLIEGAFRFPDPETFI